MKISVNFKGKNNLIDVRKTGFFGKGLGLTFRTKNTENLLFEFSRAVNWQGNLTSIFVFFPFMTLWLNDKNKVIDFRVVRPFEFCIRQKKKFHKIVEIPLNDKNKSIIVRFIGKDKYSRYSRRGF